MKRTVQLAALGISSVFVCSVFALLAFSALSAFPGSSARADGPTAPKNLQVLPKTTTKEQVKVIMKAQAKALGVECDFCHDVPDMAADTNEHKKIARQMMKMTEEINAKWIKAAIKDAAKHPVTCNTCHMGKESPAQ